MPTKPLGRKAYGSIGHLPGSHCGPGDHHITDGQAQICWTQARDRHDRVLVQEKLDGSNVAVAKINGTLIPLVRAGYPAITSPYPHHALFAAWAQAHAARFAAVLQEGERLVGEWFALAHGTRYALPHEPFVAFDLMREATRLPYDAFQARLDGRFVTPAVIHDGPPCPLETAQAYLATGGRHGALDPPEGAVWRVERRGQVDFLAKWVLPDKVDGRYLPEISGQEALWLWTPGPVVVAPSDCTVPAIPGEHWRAAYPPYRRCQPPVSHKGATETYGSSSLGG